MGCLGIVLLAVVALLAGVLAHDSPDQAYNPKMIVHYVPVVSNSLPKSTITTASKRLLRSYEAEVSGDERVNVPGLSKLDDLVQKIVKSKPSTEKAVVKAWLQSPVHPKELLRALRLGKGTMKLDANPNLLQWFRIVAAYRAKNGDQAFSDLDIYYLLLKTNSAQDLTTLFRPLKDSPGLEKIAANWEFATLFQSLKDVPDLKKLAENMQTYQFQEWLRMKISPEVVASVLAIPNPVYTGGETMLEKVKTFFTNDNPVDALTAVTKLQ
ncbi:hypothetical protein PI125_g5360 [Phytophthora idaei]|nr:hypothetical protein PI125_g5360 [Phytophthora idaei]